MCISLIKSLTIWIELHLQWNMILFYLFADAHLGHQMLYHDNVARYSGAQFVHSLRHLWCHHLWSKISWHFNSLCFYRLCFSLKCVASEILAYQKTKWLLKLLKTYLHLVKLDKFRRSVIDWLLFIYLSIPFKQNKIYQVRWSSM